MATNGAALLFILGTQSPAPALHDVHTSNARWSFRRPRGWALISPLPARLVCIPGAHTLGFELLFFPVCVCVCGNGACSPEGDEIFAIYIEQLR